MYRQQAVNSEASSPAGGPPELDGVLRVRTPDNVGIGYASAGIGSRMAAQLVDSALAATAAGLTLAAYIALTRDSVAGDEKLIVAGASGAAVAVYLGYFALFELVSRGSTPGKAAVGLRVVRLNGASADPGQLVIRNVMRLVDVGLAGVGLIVMFFHPLSRRLGDLAAGTLVVRTRQATSLATATRPEPLMLRTPDEGPSIDGIARLGRHEYEVLRAFLGHPSLPPDRRAALAGRMAERLQERLGLGPAAPERRWPPELFLERLYLQLAQRRT